MRCKHAYLYDTPDELRLHQKQLTGYSRLGMLDRIRDHNETPFPLVSQPVILAKGV